MSHSLKRQCQLRLLKGATGQFSGLLPPFSDLQAHSSRRPLHKPASGHPDVGQRKQRDELCGVFGKPPLAHFDVTELALDNPKRMLHLGPHAGLDLLGWFVQCAPGRTFLSAALSRTHGHVPVHSGGLRSFAGALVARIKKDNLFFTMQQRMPLRDIVNVCGCADDGVHQARQAKPLLQAVNAQHQCKVKWRASRLGHRCVRRYERQQIGPRHDLVHFFEQDLLSRARGTEIESEVCYLHAVKDDNLRAPTEVIEVRF